MGKTYQFRLVELENSGQQRIYGPYELTVDGPNPVPPKWDDGHQDLGGGWRRTDWFGDYIPMGTDGWIWHNKHGFFYVEPHSVAHSIWLFSNEMGWLWTADTLYPFFFRAEDSAWLWYNGSVCPRWFFNLTAEEWERRP